jgi:hypothetical protein
MATLYEERQVVLGELKQAASRRSVDVLALEHIRRSLVELEAQAAALIETMLEQRATTGEMGQAQDLAAFFQYVRAQVTSLVELARGQDPQPDFPLL